MISWVTIIWSMTASACLTLAAIHLMVWFKKRTARTNLAFSSLAVAAAAMAAGELWLMQSGSVGQFVTAVRWHHVPVWAAIVSLVIFTRLRLHAGRLWLAWTICIVRTLSLLLNFLVRPNLSYREVTGLRHIPFLGESVSIAEGVLNPLMLIAQLATLLLVIFVLDAAVSVWRRGDWRPALWIGGGILLFALASLIHSVLALWQVVSAPLMNSIFYLGLVVVMGYEITRDALRARQLSDELRESELRYRTLFDEAMEGIYRVSMDGKLLFVNPGVAKILGYDSPEEMVRLVTDVGSQVWAAPQERSYRIRQLEKGGRVWASEVQFKRKDGTLVWVSIKTHPVRGPDGQITYFDGFLEDIDERRRAHETLKARERFLAETARIGMVGGWEFDIKTGKQTWTAETYNMHEVDPTYEPTVEKGLSFYTPDSRAIIEKAVRSAIEQGTPYDLELEMVTAKGNHRDVRTIGRADPAHHRVYGFIQDISERKQNEREMAELRLERTHMARVLAVNEISASLAHEINQPLGAILNNAETAKILLSRDHGRQEDFPEIVDDIIQDARRAGEIVRKVRSIVKKGEGQFEIMPVNGLIDEVLAILRNNLLLNDVTLNRELMQEVADIRGDRVRLQQVLLNLLTNALDAMKEAPIRKLTVRSAKDGPDAVIVSVSDSGPGVAEANRAMLFQPLFTTKREGLGLGLSICQSIIEEHGGRIWQDNNPGGGATFSFSLNAWREESF